MPKDVAEALKKPATGIPPRAAAAGRDLGHEVEPGDAHPVANQSGADQAMIPELGHFALALAVRHRRARRRCCRWSARSARDARLMAAAPALALGQFIALATAYRLPGLERRRRRLLGAQRGGELATSLSR